MYATAGKDFRRASSIHEIRPLLRSNNSSINVSEYGGSANGDGKGAGAGGLPPLPPRLGSIGYIGYSMSRSASKRGLTPEEVEDWNAEHCWRTWIFMVMDHMYYNKLAWIVGAFMCIVTIISCLAFVLGSVPSLRYTPDTCRNPICTPETGPCSRMVCYPQPRREVDHIESWTMIFFVVDYLIRVGCVSAVPQRLIYWNGHKCSMIHKTGHQPPGWYKVYDYLTHFNQLVDVAVIAPYLVRLLLMGTSIDFDSMRLFRMTRVLRVFKLARYSEGCGMIWKTLQRSGPALMLLVLITAVLTLILGTLIYHFEGGEFRVTDEYPEGAFFRRTLTGKQEISPFSSIPIGAYWVIMTSTTVGYGDLYPTTPCGQAVAAVLAYAGIIAIALPVAVVVKHFNIEFDQMEQDMVVDEKLEAIEKARESGCQTPELLMDQLMQEKALEMQTYIADALQLATPLWEALWTDFATKHLQAKLKNVHDEEMEGCISV